MRGLAVVAFALLLLAGCGQPAPEPAPAAKFDGDAAMDWVEGLVTHPDGSPRFRVPNTPAHDKAAQWLHDAMQAPGWTVSWQNFTGADYVKHPKGQAQLYADRCDAHDKARLPNLEFSNLVARYDAPGTDQAMALGAHWESKAEATNDPVLANRSKPVLGANDGASGVGVLLELMWHVARHGAPAGMDLVVAFFDGEDGFEDCHPIAGSIHFVQSLAPGEVDRFLLLDMVGDPEAQLVREAAGKRCDPGLAELLGKHMPLVGLSGNVAKDDVSIQDDHIPFLEAGIPSGDLIDAGRPRTFPPYWHSTQDTLDKLDAEMLGKVGELVLAVLRDPAFTAQWPAKCAA